ncbi:hypothetical protein KJ652_01085 [Patescibacteria group bacterium]|nr:hypothetical protein [Patescibacteria group bacterium]MBU1123164.1 hypothetical protein [Patescibacteria group bacterium]MBU1911885.1 hypothetical protein [Patescibacteria group bacterium]
MSSKLSEATALKSLLLYIEQETESVPLSELSEEQIRSIAQKTADFARLTLSKTTETELSQEVANGELCPEYLEQICTMASRLASIEITDGEEAVSTLRIHGFEIRKFSPTIFEPNDPRLAEAPNEWLFDQVQNDALPHSAIETDDTIMICEVRPKPDVVSDTLWMQVAYENEPFGEELAVLHRKLDGDKPEKRIDPQSRAGFTFRELETDVLPALSKKAGVNFECMPTIHACILANAHPNISAGRSTEWRGDTIGDSHAIISGRSVRGPIRHTYYDEIDDPYANRGFRLCVRLTLPSS